MMIFFALLAFIVAEFYTLDLVMDEVGVLATLGLLILSAVVGTQWTKQEGLSTLATLGQKLHQGEGTGLELIKGGLLLAAGLLFIIPGFLSDLLALLLVIPPSRHGVALLLAAYFARRGTVHTYTAAGDVILEGEVCDRSESRPDSVAQLPPATKDEHGFSLVQLVVIFVLGGVVAGAVVPLLKERFMAKGVAEPLQLMQEMKGPISDWYAKHHRWPVLGMDIQVMSAGRYTDTIVISQSDHRPPGSLTLTATYMKEKGDGRVTGKTLHLVTRDGGTTWNCVPGTAEARYLPPPCQSTEAATPPPAAPR